jgi:pimeloyl-ACP methyl ester carboxylesterase
VVRPATTQTAFEPPRLRGRGRCIYGWTVIEQLTVDVGIPLRLRAWGDPAAPAMLLLHGLTGDGSSSRLVTTDAGHLVHATEPGEFCRVVEEFLAVVV